MSCIQLILILRVWNTVFRVDKETSVLELKRQESEELLKLEILILELHCCNNKIQGSSFI